MSASSLPVLFLSHGSPMQAVEPGLVGAAWAELGKTLPRPRAILMVSAHWESGAPLLTGSAYPETIHDFGGFPPELYRIRYPAPGDPELAAVLRDRLQLAEHAAGIDGSRGLDHGAWVPLVHMYPQADIPVLQLSVQRGGCARHHYSVGRALEGLSEEGVLVIASGHMTHNLGDWFRAAKATAPLDYAAAFRDWVHARVMRGDAEGLFDWETEAPHARRAHPTPEHFLPLFVALGAAGANYRPQLITTGYLGAALAIDSYRFDR